MKHIYQIKSILLWLAVFALCLIPPACSGGGTNSGTRNEPESETERPAADIRLTNAGAAGYIIVRPEAADKPDIVADAV